MNINVGFHTDLDCFHTVITNLSNVAQLCSPMNRLMDYWNIIVSLSGASETPDVQLSVKANNKVGVHSVAYFFTLVTN